MGGGPDAGSEAERRITIAECHDRWVANIDASPRTVETTVRIYGDFLRSTLPGGISPMVQAPPNSRQVDLGKSIVYFLPSQWDL